MPDIAASLPLLSAGFVLGVAHALEADHLLAVSAFARQRTSVSGAMRVSLRWAFGHNLSMLLVVLTVLAAGSGVPAELGVWADRLAGLLLVVVGLWVARDLMHVSRGQTDRAVLPAHGGDRKATMAFGMLHGTASAAALMVAIPFAWQTSAGMVTIYLLLFALGTLVTMLLFGGLFGMLVQGMQRWLQPLQAVIAVATIGIGLGMLVGF